MVARLNISLLATKKEKRYIKLKVNPLIVD